MSPKRFILWSCIWCENVHLNIIKSLLWWLSKMRYEYVKWNEISFLYVGFIPSSFYVWKTNAMMKKIQFSFQQGEERRYTWLIIFSCVKVILSLFFHFSLSETLVVFLMQWNSMMQKQNIIVISINILCH